MQVTQLEDKDIKPITDSDGKTIIPLAAYTFHDGKFHDGKFQNKGTFYKLRAEDYHPIAQRARTSNPVPTPFPERTIEELQNWECYANSSLTGGCVVKNNPFGRRSVVYACNVPKDWPGDRAQTLPMAAAVCEMLGTMVVGDCIEPSRETYQKAGCVMVASLPFEKRPIPNWPADALKQQGLDPSPMIYSWIRPPDGQLRGALPPIIECKDEQSFNRESEKAFQRITNQERAAWGTEEIRIAQALPEKIGNAWAYFCDSKNVPREKQIQALKGKIPGLPADIPENLQKAALFRLEHPRSRESSPSLGR